MSLFPKFQVKREAPAIPAIPAIRGGDAVRNSENSGNSNPPTLEQTTSEQPDPVTSDTPSLDQEHVAPTSDVARNSGNSTNSNPAVPVQTPLEPPKAKERLCYECGHFQRSPYGYPLGLCQQHDNRIQHTTSQPTQFGCGEFTFRQAGDDTRTCLTCRHYNDMSTMCSQVNIGCPYPLIPPCSGDKFQRKLQVIKSNKGAANVDLA